MQVQPWNPYQFGRAQTDDTGTAQLRMEGPNLPAGQYQIQLDNQNPRRPPPTRVVQLKDGEYELLDEAPPHRLFHAARTPDEVPWQIGGSSTDW